MNKMKRVLLRNVLLIVGIFGFIIVIYSGRGQLRETWEILSNVSLWTALSLPILQLCSYFWLSNYYRAILGNFAGKIGAWRAYGTTIALNFVNQILPSGGASGITYIIYAFKDAATPAQITIAQIGRYIFGFLSYVPLLIGAYILLLASGDLNQQLNVMLIGLMIISMPGILLLVSALNSRKAVDGVVGFIFRLINGVTNLFRKNKAELLTMDKAKSFLDDFHKGLKYLRSQGSKVIQPYIFMLLSTITEVLIVNMAFWIDGADINPGIIMVAFAAANVVGAISIIPGDVGVHELTVITVLNYVGVDESVAIAGTLLYRVFNKFIIMGIGFTFYVKYLKPLAQNVQSNDPNS